jgi:hypothetical protein
MSTRACALVVWLAAASVLHATEFTLRLGPSGSAGPGGDRASIDPRTGAGLLDTCGIVRGVDALVTAQASPGDASGCADSTFVSESLAAAAAHAQAASDSSGLPLLLRAFSDLQPAGADSAAIYSFLASLTASSQEAPGVGPFSDAAISSNQVAAADFLAWFRNEPGVTAARPLRRQVRGSGFRLASVVVAAAIAVGLVTLFAVWLVLRRTRRTGF